MFTGEARIQAEAIAGLYDENPFRPQWHARARTARDPGSNTAQPSAVAGRGQVPRVLPGLAERAQRLVHAFRGQLATGGDAEPVDGAVYASLVRFHLAQQLVPLWQSLSSACQDGTLTRRRVVSYRLFMEEAERLLAVPNAPAADAPDWPHLFAVLFQRYRAKLAIDGAIVGEAAAVAALRAAAWESLFGADMARYERGLFRSLGQVPTLIVGPAGTDTESIARVLAISRYIPFDGDRLRFGGEPAARFFSVDVRAHSEAGTVSELFGGGVSRQTAAVEDDSQDGRRQVGVSGVLELCSKGGCLFLDGVGEMPSHLATRVRRLLESGTFARGGDGCVIDFAGKLVCATDRDLVAAVDGGQFSQQLYHLLSADTLTVPSLGAQLRQAPGDLPALVDSVLSALLDTQDLPGVSADVVAFIRAELDGYGWPGQMRELRQCVIGIVLRGEYRPSPRLPKEADRTLGSLARRFVATDFDADGLLDAYCTLMYKRTGSYQEAARRLGLDRRTVKSRVDETLLTELP